MKPTELLHNNADPRILGILRFAVFGLWLILIINTPLTIYADLPSESFSTWGFYQLLFSNLPPEILASILSYEFLFGLKIVLIVCTVLCTAGVRPFKPLAIITIILIFIFDGIVKGFYGFTNHAQLGALYCAIVLSFFPAADGFSFLGDKKTVKTSNQYSLPVIISAFLICLPYSFIGLHRLFYGGAEIFTGDALLQYMSVQSMHYAEYDFRLGLLILESDVIAAFLKLGFFIITIFEILTPLVLINRLFRYVWLVIIIPFHFLTLLTMNIFFWENLILISVLLTGLPYWMRDNVLIKYSAYDDLSFQNSA